MNQSFISIPLLGWTGPVGINKAHIIKFYTQDEGCIIQLSNGDTHHTPMTNNQLMEVLASQ